MVMIVSFSDRDVFMLQMCGRIYSVSAPKNSLVRRLQTSLFNSYR